jgi:hypothetical protein
MSQVGTVVYFCGGQPESIPDPVPIHGSIGSKMVEVGPGIVPRDGYIYGYSRPVDGSSVLESC